MKIISTFLLTFFFFFSFPLFAEEEKESTFYQEVSFENEFEEEGFQDEENFNEFRKDLKLSRFERLSKTALVVRDLFKKEFNNFQKTRIEPKHIFIVWILNLPYIYFLLKLDPAPNDVVINPQRRLPPAIGIAVSCTVGSGLLILKSYIANDPIKDEFNGLPPIVAATLMPAVLTLYTIAPNLPHLIGGFIQPEYLPFLLVGVARQILGEADGIF